MALDWEAVIIPAIVTAGAGAMGTWVTAQVTQGQLLARIEARLTALLDNLKDDMKDVQRDKVDKSVHEISCVKINSDILHLKETTDKSFQNVEHKINNVAHRITGLETRR